MFRGNLAPQPSVAKIPLTSTNLDFTHSPWKIFTDVQITRCVYPVIKAFPVEFIYFYIVHDIKPKLCELLLLSQAPWKDHLVWLH